MLNRFMCMVQTNVFKVTLMNLTDWLYTAYYIIMDIQLHSIYTCLGMLLCTKRASNDIYV